MLYEVITDSAFGFITMKNGATIILESSWAINMVDIGEARTMLCGTEGGADMTNGLRINGEKNSRLYDTKIDLGAGGVAFRITSYNVCYTKLLRFGRGFSAAPCPRERRPAGRAFSPRGRRGFPRV